MRLINADELKQTLGKSTVTIIGYGKAVILDTAYDIIDNAPTVEYTFEEAFQKTVCEQRLYCPARPQGKWIPVSERLPDNDGGCYLVSLDNGQIVVADSGGIIENHDFEPKMLAWQPLPEPYKKGGAE